MPHENPIPPEQASCDLCGDNAQPMNLRAQCHMTAPLLASLEDGVLTLRCYVPECGRVVATFNVADSSTPPEQKPWELDARLRRIVDALADQQMFDAANVILESIIERKYLQSRVVELEEEKAKTIDNAVRVMTGCDKHKDISWHEFIELFCCPLCTSARVVELERMLAIDRAADDANALLASRQSQT